MCYLLKMVCIVLSLIQLIGAIPIQCKLYTEVSEIMKHCEPVVKMIGKNSSCATSYVPVVSKKGISFSEFVCKFALSLKTLSLRDEKSHLQSEKKNASLSASLNLKPECAMFTKVMEPLYMSLIHFSGNKECKVDYGNEEYLGMTLNTSLQFFKNQLFKKNICTNITRTI